MSIEIDITNKRFGHWTALYKDPLNKKRWICRCDCGCIESKQKNTIKYGTSTKCMKCRGIEQQNKKEFSDFAYKQIQRGAIKRKIYFNLTKEYIYELFLKQNKKCALSGLNIEFSITHKDYLNHKTTASLDRIDSSKDYIENNVQWVHKKINLIKNTLDQKRFIELCQKVVDTKI